MTKTHGHRGRANGSPEYQAWCGMKKRCLSPTHKSFPDYGGRGIAVCPAWTESFEAFYSDMGPRPDGYSLDRIDFDGDYEPSNCRWASLIDQQRNKRTCHRLIFQGQATTVPEMSERFGVRQDTIRTRLRRGWSVERAVR